MADNRQIASVLALIAGIITLGLGLLMGLVFSVIGGLAGFAAGYGGMGWPESAFVGVIGAIGAIFFAVGIASGIVLLIASGRLKEDDAETRRQWAVWAIVAGGVSLLGPGSLVTGGLGVAAGVVTLSDLNRPGP
jgi:hypothetical protein